MVHVQTSTFILLFASVFARILNVFSLNQTDKNLSVPSKDIIFNATSAVNRSQISNDDHVEAKPITNPEKAVIKDEIKPVEHSQNGIVHFLLFTVCVLIILFVLFHNRRKIMGLLLEGRTVRRSGRSPRYQRVSQTEHILIDEET